jgi:hypothetical protein
MNNLFKLKSFLDDNFYTTINYEFLKVFNAEIYEDPELGKINPFLRSQNPTFALLFSLFRLGQDCHKDYVTKVIPESILEVLLKNNVLINDNDHYKSQNLSIVPINGKYIFTPLPERFNTSEFNSPVSSISSGEKKLVNLITSVILNDNDKLFELNSKTGILGLTLADKLKTVHISCISTKRKELIERSISINGLNNVTLHLENQIDYSNFEKFDFIVSDYSIFDYIYNNKCVYYLNNDILSFSSRLRNIINSCICENGRFLFYLTSIGSQKKINDYEHDFLGLASNYRSIVVEKTPFDLFHLNMAKNLYTYKDYYLNAVMPEWLNKELSSFYNLCSSKKISCDYVYEHIFTSQKKDSNNIYPLYNPMYSDEFIKYGYLQQ